MGRVRIETKYVKEDGTYATGMELKDGIFRPLEQKEGTYSKLTGRYEKRGIRYLTFHLDATENGDRKRQINTAFRGVGPSNGTNVAYKTEAGSNSISTTDVKSDSQVLGSGFPIGIWQRMVIDNQPVGDWYPAGVTTMQPAIRSSFNLNWDNSSSSSSNNNNNSTR